MTRWSWDSSHALALWHYWVPEKREKNTQTSSQSVFWWWHLVSLQMWQLWIDCESFLSLSLSLHLLSLCHSISLSPSLPLSLSVSFSLSVRAQNRFSVFETEQTVQEASGASFTSKSQNLQMPLTGGDEPVNSHQHISHGGIRLTSMQTCLHQEAISVNNHTHVHITQY